MRKVTLLGGFSALAAVVCLAAPSAFAQTAEATSEEQAANVDDVVVTARRRAEQVQDVPISMAVMNAAALERKGVSGLRDIDKDLVNVSIGGATNRGGNASSIAIRGISNPGAFVNRDPGVGFYIDDVYFGRVDGNLMGFQDPERIEVLRGPQGTLFGKNSTGGAIRLVSKTPQFGEYFGSVDGTYGSYDRVDFRAMANLPITDTLAARISVGLQGGGGFFEREIDGEKVGDNEFQGARVQLRWQPNEKFDTNFNLFAVNSASNGGAVKLTGVGTNALRVRNYHAEKNASDPRYTADYITDDFYSTYGGDIERYTYGGYIAALTSTYTFNENLQAKLILGYNDTEATYHEDRDLSPAKVYAQDTRSFFDSHSAELQLLGTWNKLEWVAGLFYFYENPIEYLNVYDFVEPNEPGAPSNVLRVSNQETKSYAAFTQGTYHFSDALKLTAGVRYTREEKSITSTSDDVRTGPRTVTSPFYPAGAQASDVFEDVSPMVTLAYHPSSNAMVYGTVAKGFRSGGINDVLTPELDNNGVFGFDPETLMSYEIGLKSDWFNRKVTFNLSAFSSVYEDIQVNVIHPVASKRYIGNIKEAEIRGAELELGYRPLPNLRFNAGVGLLEAEYKDLGSSGPSLAKSAITLDTPFPRTPELSYTIGVQYEYALANEGEVSFSGSYGFKDEQYSTSQKSNSVYQPDYGLASFRVQYNAPGDRWYAAAFCNNCFSEEYLTGGTNFSGNSGHGSIRSEVGRPQEFGVSLGRKF